jgi:hypothetical protein
MKRIIRERLNNRHGDPGYRFAPSGLLTHALEPITPAAYHYRSAAPGR